MLIASHPVLTSLKEGPTTGTLIWIRLLDKEELGNFSELAESPLSLYPFDQQPEGTIKIPDAQMLKDQVYVHPVNSQTILGFRYLSDFNGERRLVLQVENNRELYQQGLSTALIFGGPSPAGIVVFYRHPSFHERFPCFTQVGPENLTAFPDHCAPIE